MFVWINMLRLLWIVGWMTVAAFAQLRDGFDEGPLGERPAGWFTSKGHLEKPFVWERTEECLGRTGGCVMVRWTGQQAPTQDSWTNLMRTVDATPYRGKRVRLRIQAATEAPHVLSSGRLWLRVDRPGGQVGFFDNMEDRPIRKAQWAPYEITGDIEADAAQLAFGFVHNASGWSRFDDFSLEILGDAPPQVDLARPLTEAGRRNVRAFAKLYGYVRFFYPSVATAATDWEEFVVNGVKAVEGAESTAELASRLKELFRPVAPEVEIGVTGPAKPLTAERVLVWRHDGVYLGQSRIAMNIYTSKLEVKPVVNGESRKPYEAEIAPGLRVRVPLALPAAGESAPEVSWAPQRPRSYKTATNRAARLATVILSWNVFQHFFPYFEQARADWNDVLVRTLDDVAAKEGDAPTAASLRRMVAALEDGHGSVYGPDSPRLSAPLALVRVEGRIVVAQVGDAQGQPIARGDVIVKVNGRPVEEVYAEVAGEISGASKGWISWLALSRLLSGPDAGPVVLEVEPFGGEAGARREVKLTRASGPATREADHGRSREMEPGIWYVNLDRIEKKEWDAALPKLAEAKGIVFDMRGYPSMGPEFLQHMTKEPLKSAQWHVPMALAPDRTSVEWTRRGEWSLEPKAPYLSAPRVFLLDGTAISYAETVMGIVEAYKLGPIVGGPSAATNGNVNPFVTPGGYNFGWSGMKVIKHDGTRHHGVGIRPTHPVERTRAGVAEGRDELLEKALEMVKTRP